MFIETNALPLSYAMHHHPKMFAVNSWISQINCQWIPDCWSGEKKARLPVVNIGLC